MGPSYDCVNRKPDPSLPSDGGLFNRTEKLNGGNRVHQKNIAVIPVAWTSVSQSRIGTLV
jgi:hypothetical protein